MGRTKIYCSSAERVAAHRQRAQQKRAETERLAGCARNLAAGVRSASRRKVAPFSELASDNDIECLDKLLQHIITGKQKKLPKGSVTNGRKATTEAAKG